MDSKQHDEFPIGAKFLFNLQSEIDDFSLKADEFASESGQKLLLTFECLGSVLSILYRLACCAWGCRGGDHQTEWLTGRVVNQSLGAHRLVRAGYYDEALMLIRGIGETANLLWLFLYSASAFDKWKAANAKERRNEFGPAAVRKRLEIAIELGPPIDRKRYARLCEVGTHPMPGIAPGHYSGTGRPVLGCVIQPVGVYVCMTELGYAVSMCAFPLSILLDVDSAVAKSLSEEAPKLLRALGAFTVLSYEDMLADVLEKTTTD